MATLKTTLSRLRWYFTNLLNYARNARYRHGGSSKVVLFDLRENVFHRYLMIFMHFLEIEGYTIQVRWRTGLLSSWATDELFRQIKGIRLVGSERTVPTIGWVFSDHVLERPHVLLDPDYFAGAITDATVYRMPMPMVDTFYLNRTHDRTARDPGEVREKGAFFFGNMDPGHYDRPEIGEAFGCLTRDAFIRTLRKGLPDRIKEPTELNDAHVENDRYIVLMGRHKRYIKPEELRPILERFDFFLAPSGVVMPLCHNLVEAMSVGCIPILQHAHLLSPPLRDQEECLLFSTPEELTGLLRQLPTLGQAAIERMRRNVLAYYAAHLTPAAVIGELERRGSALRRIELNAEWPSTQLLLERSRRAHGKEV